MVEQWLKAAKTIVISAGKNREWLIQIYARGLFSPTPLVEALSRPKRNYFWLNGEAQDKFSQVLYSTFATLG
ncbi:hypothetical protein MiSe_30200 [Microseira wollei NIES-4236]|uniref:Uncharacterized protein n=1 Tax=Microseira wollei NIES-4236 TaxID=2530354 RepID=A0AAV3XCU8_9CYAN|nr:hypothetical protein MiSe_30200 [Microseira wollei NIES-4236]